MWGTFRQADLRGLQTFIHAKIIPHLVPLWQKTVRILAEREDHNL